MDYTSDDGYYIYTKYITLKDGTRIYAEQYGKRAFRIWVSSKKKQLNGNEMVAAHLIF